MRIENGCLYDVFNSDISSEGAFTIPDSVTSIGGDAFEDCTGLTSVTIPSGVTSIGQSAFYGCTGLTSVTIGEGVANIGSYVFSGCGNLASIVVENGNTTYHSAGNCLIETASQTLIAGCKSSIIPTDGSVTVIGNYAFSGCSALTSISIPNSVTSIGNVAFYNCAGLTSVTIGNGVTSIGDSAFYGCRSLRSFSKNYKAFCLTNRGRLYARASHELRFNLNRKTSCEGNLKICKKGIHYCTNLFDIFNYYSGEYGKDFVIIICDVSDENIGNDSDSKRCARWVRPTKILNREEVIKILNGGVI